MGKKIYILYFLIIIVLTLICVEIGLNINTNTKNDIFSRNQWSQKKKQLDNLELSKITFYTGGRSGKNIELTGVEKDNFMNCLLTSEFYRSNRTGQIDSGVAIILISKDGSQDSFQYCGAGVFQIWYKENIFSIKNKELEQILLKYNVTL
jgi:hypothetical protein